MGCLDDLRTARDRYAAELAGQQHPPEYAWNEYEEFLLSQIEKLTRLIAEAEAAEAAQQAAEEGEQISAGFTL